MPYARADSIMHPDRGALAMGVQCHGTIGTMVNPPLDDDRIYFFYLFVEKVHIKETKQMTSQLDRKVHDSNTCPTLKHKNTLKNKNTNIQKHE